MPRLGSEDDSTRAGCCEGWSWTGIALALAGVVLLSVAVFTNNHDAFLIKKVDEAQTTYGCMVRAHVADSTNRTVGVANIGVWTKLDFPGTAYAYSTCSNETWKWRTGAFLVPQSGFYRISGRINYVYLKAFSLEIYRNNVKLVSGTEIGGIPSVTFETFTWAAEGDVLQIWHAPADNEEDVVGKIGAESYVFIKEEEFDAPLVETAAPVVAVAPTFGVLTPLSGTRHIINSSLVLRWASVGTTTYGSLRRLVEGGSYTLVTESITTANNNYTVTTPTAANNVTYSLLDHMGAAASVMLYITAIPTFNITSPVASSNQTGGAAATLTWSPDATCVHYTFDLSVLLAGNATYTSIATGVNASSAARTGYTWPAVPGSTILRVAVTGYATQYYTDRAFTIV